MVEKERAEQMACKMQHLAQEKHLERRRFFLPRCTNNRGDRVRKLQNPMETFASVDGSSSSSIISLVVNLMLLVSIRTSNIHVLTLTFGLV